MIPSARRPTPFLRFAAVLLGGLLAVGCVSDTVREAAETVLTLQSGTVAELRERRGTGPYTVYDVAPEVMVGVLEDAARRARGAGGDPITAVFVSKQRGEVLAKERSAEDAGDASYGTAFRTAMLAIVHPVRGDPAASRVEIHSLQRGPFHRGQVAWQRDLPGWIAAVLAERAATEGQPPVAIPDAPGRSLPDDDGVSGSSGRSGR